ncbi:hypothetical protein [Cytobacillus praedii]|uniref:hypothetical protein n=1 Tax=Cytobacillus praedii TaxID=1742358 RepID=UPI002E22B7F8|nr:hypothetical protein [Cytobacillus praedii]
MNSDELYIFILIIKEYVFTNCMNEIEKILQRHNITKGGEPITKSYIVDVLNSKPKDELHRILRAGYRLKLNLIGLNKVEIYKGVLIIMREKARIQRMLSLLEKIWEQQQDVRFNQLVANLQHMYSIQNEGYGKRKIKEKDFLGQEIDSSYLDFFFRR